MKFLPIIPLLFFLCESYAQERIEVYGQVKSGGSSLQDVHVKNVSTGKYSVSDANGDFQLNIRKGDTLLLSHVGMEDLVIFSEKEDLKKQPLIFKMREASSELREVVVDENPEINAVSLGIIPKKIEKLSVNERRLKTAGDFKPIHLLGILGGSLPIDPILNAINGRTKKLKRNIEIEEKEQHITFLELHFMEYLEKEMRLSDHEARLLINRVIEDDELRRVINGGNKGEMEFFLLDHWLKYKNEPVTPEEPK